MDGGAETTPVNFVMPIGIPISEVTRIPISRLPRTFSTTRADVMKKPMMARMTSGLPRSPRATEVDSLLTMRPTLRRPMKAMYKPIPTPMAFFMPTGIASTISVRMFVTVNRMKIRPSRKTAVRANCQLRPMPRQTVKTKKALRPIPGARPKGFLA